MSPEIVRALACSPVAGAPAVDKRTVNFRLLLRRMTFSTSRSQEMPDCRKNIRCRAHRHPAMRSSVFGTTFPSHDAHYTDHGRCNHCTEASLQRTNAHAKYTCAPSRIKKRRKATRVSENQRQTENGGVCYAITYTNRGPCDI